MELQKVSSDTASEVELWDVRRVLAETRFGSRTTVWNLVRERKFPEPIRLGRRTFWIADEIRSFARDEVRKAIAARRGSAV